MALDDLATTWSRIAMAGRCTMSKDLDGWLLPQVSKARQRAESEGEYLTLKTLAKVLSIPDREKLLAQQHNAGADAEAALQLFAAVLCWVRPRPHGSA